ncbi:hypothetical protein FRC06_001319 [Ceratobasidium sp. 370]|nr:hypothetical protein FRC06_001319 [Ceratobasidium sp. 370]
MAASRSPTPTLNGESRLPKSPTLESRAAEERAEREAENTDVIRPAEGPGARTPVATKFAHTVFDPKIAHLRKIYTKIMGMTLVLTIVMMGSLARTSTHAPSLKTWVVDRDGGEIGQAIVQGLLATTQSGTKQHLGWRQIPADQVGDVGEAVVDEQAWGAVVINAGASTRLAAARASGNSSYNPASAITFYYAQARNEQATGSYVNPLTTAALTQIEIQTMTNDAARGILGPFLKLRSYLWLRILVPLGLYFPLSLAFAMVSLPFHAPFGTKYTYAGGFFLYFAYTYMGMAALGLATEAMITILTPRFMAFFLIPLIIVNVSVATLPFDLQPWFYQYGHAFPVFNNTQAVRTILFNTKNHLGLNAGVILGWCALSCVTIPLFTTLMRGRDVQAYQKAMEEKKGGEKGMA